jgi:di/tricarboxylate transporter
MSGSAITLLILAATVAVFVWNRLPVAVVAVLNALALYLAGVASAANVLAGFGDPVVVFIAALFVVAEGLDAAGVTNWAGQRLTERVGRNARLLLTVVMLLCAVFAALVTPNASVAALVPMVVLLAGRTGQPPSRMLIPLAFAGSAGALLALTGSPVNVLVSEASAEAGAGGFGFLEFAIVGLPLVLVTTVIAVWVGPSLLPTRPPGSTTRDLSRHARTLATHYELRDGFYRLRVREGSPLIGRTTAGLHLDRYPAVRLIAVQRGGGERVEPADPLAVDDILVVTGSSDAVSSMVISQTLAVSMSPLTLHEPTELVSAERGVVEVVVPPRSVLVGTSMFPGMARGPELVVLGIRRLGHDLVEPSEIRAGDAVLLHGAWPAIEELADSHDVLVVDSPDLLRRHAGPLGSRAWRALAVLALMVALLLSGAVVPALAALGAATGMVLARVLTVPQAFRGVSWETVVLIGGLLPLSGAIKSSGAADQIAAVLLDVVGSGRPYLLLVGLFVLTATLGQVISNAATVLVVLPIALAAAAEAHVAVRPVLMLVAVAGAASFLTPIATPANTMVMEPAGYRFGDYWKFGLVVMTAWLAVALAIIPVVWRF